jgi:hypothetical protein
VPASALLYFTYYRLKTLIVQECENAIAHFVENNIVEHMDTHYLHRAHENERAIQSGDVYFRLELKQYDVKLQKLLDGINGDSSNAIAWTAVGTACKYLIDRLGYLKDLCKVVNEPEGGNEPTALDDEEAVNTLWGCLTTAHALYKIVTAPMYPDRDQDWKLLLEIETDLYKLAPLRLDIPVVPVSVPEENSPMPDNMGSHSPSLEAMIATLGVPGVSKWSIDDETAGFWSQNSLDYDGSMEKHGLQRLAAVLPEEGEGPFGREFFAKQLREIARTTYRDPDPETGDHYRKDKHDALTFLADQVIKLSEARSFREGSEC